MGSGGGERINVVWYELNRQTMHSLFAGNFVRVKISFSVICELLLSYGITSHTARTLSKYKEMAAVYFRGWFCVLRNYRTLSLKYGTDKILSHMKISPIAVSVLSFASMLLKGPPFLFHFSQKISLEEEETCFKTSRQRRENGCFIEKRFAPSGASSVLRLMKAQRGRNVSR